MTQYFTPADVWMGAFYELRLVLGPSSARSRQAAWDRLWRHPALDGCYRDCRREPADQPQVAPAAILAAGSSRAVGLAQLPNAARVACGADCYSRPDLGIDVLAFYLPEGALATAYPPEGYPFLKASWQGALDAWLLDLARFVFATVPLELGVIGCEIPSVTSLYEVQAKEVDYDGSPAARWFAYCAPVAGRLEYFPPQSG